MKNKHVIQAIKFTLFSISAGIIQLISTTLLNEVLHLNYPASYAIGLVLSVLWNFTFNRKFTFKSANNVPFAMFLTFCYYLIFGPLSYYTTYVLYPKNALPLTPIPEIAMTVIMMLVNFVTEFLYQKLVVFRGSIDSAVNKDEETFKKIITICKTKI